MHRAPHAAAAASIVFCLAGTALAQQNLTVTVDSRGPTGSNHAAAHALRDGTGVNIGIVEVADQDAAGNATMGIIAGNLGARLLAQRDYRTLQPGFAGVIPAAPGNANHATLVSSCAASNATANMIGVAKGANVVFGGIGGAGQAGFTNSLRLATSHMRSANGVALFNNSWGYTGLNDNGANADAVYMDWFQNRYDSLMTVAAGNDGHVNAGGGVFNDGTRIMGRPADLYNGITVGAVDNTFGTRATYSSFWMTGDNGTQPDARCKPDILAPGTGMDDALSYPGPNFTRPNRGTSFAAPHVIGAAALLVQNGLALGGGAPAGGGRPPDNHLAVKALLMNSARKRGITGENSANNTALDYSGGFSNVTRTDQQTSDQDYLQGANTLRVGATPANGAPPNPTAQWTPSKWFKNPGPFDPFFTQRPLDDEQGTGVLDAKRALVNMNGGEQHPGPITPVGWDRGNVATGTSTRAYDLNVSIPQGSFVTATVCWDRLITETDDTTSAGHAIDTVDLNDTYAPAGAAGVNGLADLDLYFNYHGTLGNFLLAGSISVDDNVEHLHIPVGFNINPGELSIEVRLANANGLGTIDYGLAWWTVPTPSGLSLLVLAGIAGARRRRS
jgi:MYXO-CTERM domain-containing protein